MFQKILPVMVGLVVGFGASTATPQTCPGDFPLSNYDGVGQVTCPCFIPGEEAGVVLTAPVSHYPIEILKITVTWASQFSGSPQSLEQALHLYAGSLPDPGVPIFSLPGPLLTDGFANQFDVSQIPGNKTIQSGAFTISLQFLNQNYGQIFAPSVVHDGNGCQGNLNVVKAIPGGWIDACVAGVTGDWIMSVEYRCDGTTDTHNLTSTTALLGAYPNPFTSESRISFSLRERTHTSVAVFDVRGRVVQTLTKQFYAPGQHFVSWKGHNAAGERVAPGIYLLRMDAGTETFTKKVVLR